MARVIPIAHNEQRHHNGDRSITDQVLAVLFEEVYGETDILGKLVGL
jgi:hypothetical protein